MDMLKASSTEILRNLSALSTILFTGALYYYAFRFFFYFRKPNHDGALKVALTLN